MTTDTSDVIQLKIPTHIAIIADGNRRWARARNLPTLEGHRQGADNFEILLDKARELGIKCFSTWIFSTENWTRDENEVSYLFMMARKLARKHQKKCIRDKIRFIHLGRKDRLPKDLIDIIIETEEQTKDFTDFTVAVGMDYGGHDELIRAMKKVVDAGLEITEDNIEQNLDTAKLPRPDLIIRPSGEVRLSGFMSWQSAYAELYFPKVLFPDFDANELTIAIEEYSKRERRFGGTTKKA